MLAGRSCQPARTNTGASEQSVPQPFQNPSRFEGSQDVVEDEVRETGRNETNANPTRQPERVGIGGEHE